MKKIILFFLLIISVRGNGQNWIWEKHAGGASNNFGPGSTMDSGNGIFTDSIGNSYCTGYFANDAYFDSFTLSDSGQYESYVAKYDPNGNVLWVEQSIRFNPNALYAFARGYAITVDASGNSYVTGSFGGEIYFGSFLLTANGSYQDIFVAKYDPNGNVIWAKSAGGNSFFGDEGHAITVDKTGHCYITGFISGNSIFGANTLTSTGDYTAFIAKYDANGNALWGRQGDGTGSDFGTGVSVDDFSNVYITGHYRGFINFDTIGLNNSGGGLYGENIFLTKYDSNGTLLWAKQAGGSGSDVAQGISVDLAGNSFITGSFDSYFCAFDTITLARVGHGANIFLAKYNSTGNVIWAKRAGADTLTSISDAAASVGIDLSGNSYITGCFKGELLIDTSSLLSAGGYDVFSAKYNANGNMIWALRAGSTSDDISKSISVNKTGTCNITGYFSDTMHFDTTSVISFGMEDIFIAKIDSINNTTTTISSNASRQIPLMIYPNPSNGYFKIQMGNEQSLKGNISINTILGEKIYFKDNVPLNNVTIDLSYKPNGIYYISIKSDQKTITKKIIINR